MGNTSPNDKSKLVEDILERNPMEELAIYASKLFGERLGEYAVAIEKSYEDAKLPRLFFVYRGSASDDYFVEVSHNLERNGEIKAWLFRDIDDGAVDDLLKKAVPLAPLLSHPESRL